MHVFVTGASGFVGSAVVQELLSHGHTVIGLARSQASADKLKLAGAEVLHGSVRDLEALKAGATQADGVIHLAFNHDFSRWLDSCREDGEAIDALGSALVDTGKPLVVTSGVGVLSVSRAPGSTTPCAEDDPSPTSASQMPRIQSELSALPLAQQGVRVSVVRLTPTVHGKGDVGFIPAMIRAARDRSAAAYVETGDNVWPTVHRDDAAVLYRLALEKADIAAVIGKSLDVSVNSLKKDEADAHFGRLAHFAEMDLPASSDKTKATLGWEPRQIGLLEDLETGSYF